MADFIGNQTLTPGVWVDVTSGLVGQRVAIQNLSNVSVRIHFGPTAPTANDAGAVLPPLNWPPATGTIITRLWALGWGQIHVSVED